MSYADILVQIDETKTSVARAAYAAMTAHRWGARLTGVFLKSEFPAPVFTGEYPVYPTPVQVDAMVSEHEAAVMAASERAREIFEPAAAEAGVTSEWRVVQDDYTSPLTALARRTDLSILSNRARVTLGGRSIRAADVAMDSGGPVLLLPNDWTGKSTHKVLVAWNGSRESARALRDAMPYLRTARQVEVLLVDPPEDDPDGALQRYLERNGCKAEVVIERSADGAAASVIRRRADASGADLLVMGLYGHSRVQELVLGGVSRSLLRDPSVPTLISH